MSALFWLIIIDRGSVCSFCLSGLNFGFVENGFIVQLLHEHPKEGLLTKVQ
jgi:hypothetical protein